MKVQYTYQVYINVEKVAYFIWYSEYNTHIRYMSIYKIMKGS